MGVWGCRGLGVLGMLEFGVQGFGDVGVWGCRVSGMLGFGVVG